MQSNHQCIIQSAVRLDFRPFSGLNGENFAFIISANLIAFFDNKMLINRLAIACTYQKSYIQMCLFVLGVSLHQTSHHCQIRNLEPDSAKYRNLHIVLIVCSKLPQIESMWPRHTRP